jgi:hypothetical protein
MKQTPNFDLAQRDFVRITTLQSSTVSLQVRISLLGSIVSLKEPWNRQFLSVFAIFAWHARCSLLLEILLNIVGIQKRLLEGSSHEHIKRTGQIQREFAMKEQSKSPLLPYLVTLAWLLGISQQARAQFPTANADSATTVTATPVTTNVVANDTDPNGYTINVIEVTPPANGTAVNNGNGTVTYTSNAGFVGINYFDYLVSDAGIAMAHHWGLGGNANDLVGTANGTVNGATTVAGKFGNALSFNKTSNYVQIPDFNYTNAFSVAFWFKVNENSGSYSQYMYSHGTLGQANSINIAIGETGSGFPNVLQTSFNDSNEPSYTDTSLNTNIAALIGDGNWHLCVLRVTVGSGSSVYVDGSLKASSSHGGDTFNPSTNLYLGARNDLNSSRFYGGLLDGVETFGRALTATEISQMHSGGNRATVKVTVTAPLPIELVSFSARVDNSQGRVVLEWETFTETNNYGFEIERKGSGESDFSLVPNGFVAGHGTTVEPQHYSFTDAPVPSGTQWYRLKQIDLDGTVDYFDPLSVEVFAATEDGTAGFALKQNYPNPFNPTTGIRYRVSGTSHVTLVVYDVLGREVAVLVNEVKAPGSYEASFDATGLASGVYLYTLQAAGFVQTRKMLLVR